MWGIGITYIIMGGFPLWVHRRMNMETPPVLKDTWIVFLRIGILSLALYLISLFLHEPWQQMLPALPIFLLLPLLLRLHRHILGKRENNTHLDK